MKKSRDGDLNTEAKESKVGIWWDDGKTLIAIAHSQHENAYHGRYVDSELNHADKWPKIASKFRMSVESEYFEIPRGRVLFDPKQNRGIIYHGTSTTKDRLAKIAEAFDLTNWVAEIDVHYETGEQADFMFMDD